MGIVKSGGVVIAVQDSGETSRMAEVFTEIYGLIKVKAKGARRPESRLVPLLNPLPIFRAFTT